MTDQILNDDWGLVHLWHTIGSIEPGIYLCREAWLANYGDEKQWEFRRISQKQAADVLKGISVDEIWKEVENGNV